MKKLYLRKEFLKSDGGGCIPSWIRLSCLLNIDKLRLLELTSFLQLFYLLSFIRLRAGSFSPPGCAYATILHQLLFLVARPSLRT